MHTKQAISEYKLQINILWQNATWQQLLGMIKLNFLAF